MVFDNQNVIVIWRALEMCKNWLWKLLGNVIMRRKIYDSLLKWKQEKDGTTALMIEGARRVGKSYIVNWYSAELEIYGWIVSLCVGKCVLLQCNLWRYNGNR